MNLKFWPWSKESTTSSRKPGAHMTFARTSFGRSLVNTGFFLKRQIWIWPIIAVVVLSVVGYSVHSAVQSTMKDSLKSELETLLSVETEMLKNWYSVQISQAGAVADTKSVRDMVSQLVDPAASETTRSLDDLHQIRNAIVRDVAPFLDAHDHEGFFIADRNFKIVAASADETIGVQSINQYGFLAGVFDGRATVSVPMPSLTAIRDENGQLRTGRPCMFAAAPIRDDNLQIIGALALRINPEREFTRILQLGRMGKSGETYAFDRDGVLVSNSRFDHDLILTGLLPDQPDSKSILNLLLRNPGGDMTRGFRPKLRRSEMPLTKMAESATTGNKGLDVVGYGDYRGVPVVGAWTWLAEYDIGLATEIDLDEAYRPLTILSWVFWSLYGLLITASVAIFVFTLVVNRMQREARNAAVQAQELGQYKLEQKLGAGAMGVVYKGYHAMMRRPTAIKLLNIEAMNDSAIARFEHEVQITSQLNHPNTIAIYDFGRTPEGVFYYAMEYLDGIDLQTLVDQYGPQPESRVIQMLMQICGSLYEAHAQGLVHRDIKPANIMINRRGGQPDVIKVLDFGLVINVDAQHNEQGLAGTPLYMSPEAIQSPSLVDACSDLYAVGAVGYFLITGKSVFEATNVVDLLQKHVTESPLPPSGRANVTVSQAFEDVLLSCLEKSRARRPQTARDLAQMLLRCQPAGNWTVLDAEAWWTNHDRRQRPGSSSGGATFVGTTAGSLPSATTLPAAKATKENNGDTNPEKAGAPPMNVTQADKRDDTAIDQTLWHQ